MATYTKCLLSGSIDGKGIVVSASATGGSPIIHTSHATSLDEIWLYGVNTGLADIKTTIEWGEDTVPNGNIEITIPGESGLYLLVPGLLLKNNLNVNAFASSASVVVLHGFVNRIT
jgi:hypothetical protein